MESKRKKRRKLKKHLKVISVSVLSVAAVILFLVFFFRLQTVKISSDLQQFSASEVQSYMKQEGIGNTLFFWFRNKIGQSTRIDLFEEYSVKMNSPFSITITAYEKKLKGFIKESDMYYYVDENGRILKKTEEKLKDVPKITGVTYDKLTLYEPVQAKDAETLKTLVAILTSVEEYDFEISRIDISQEQEITLYIKKLEVQLGKTINLKRKLVKLKELYKNAIKYEGVLKMKRLSSDGNYTLEQPTKAKETKKNEETTTEPATTAVTE